MRRSRSGSRRTTTTWPGWIDAVQPDFTVNHNVNSGDRLGTRIALEIAPTENFTITPRFVYQNVSYDGWNRVDQYNILANPFTTTRPPVTLGADQQFTQFEEPFSDKFYLGDIKINWDCGNWEVTSITSISKRDIQVIRDATALTGSVTGGSIGLGEEIYTIDAPLDDRTFAKGWTQELRFAASMLDNRLHWLVGAFYGDTERHYNQFLNVSSFTELSGIATEGEFASNDELYFSDILYKQKEYGIFTEATFDITRFFSLTAGLRYYNYDQEKNLIFDGLFAPIFPVATVENGTVNADGVAPRFIASFHLGENATINAQASKGFRLGGINDPILLPLCQGQDIVTFGNIPTWEDETAWNYEVGAKLRFLGGRLGINPTAFYIDVTNLQAVVTAGTCSSRLVFNVPKARSVGGELEVTFAPTNHFDFAAGDQLQQRRGHGIAGRLRGHHPRDRHPGWQPAAQRARVPAGPLRDLPGAHRAELLGLRDRQLPARRLALHAAGRPGAGPRRHQSGVVRLPTPSADR